MTIEWEHVLKDIEAGDPYDHLLAMDETGYVAMRLRIEEEDGDVICAWTTVLQAGRWQVPQIEDWMIRVAAALNAEPVNPDAPPDD